MEEEIDKIYEEMFEINKRLKELDEKNAALSEKIASIFEAAPAGANNDIIMEQEGTVLDVRNLGWHKSASLPNGGVIKLRAKPMCVNGRHVIKDQDSAVLCSKCDSLMCTEHRLDTPEPMCRPCVLSAIEGFDSVSLYVLFSVAHGIKLSELKRRIGLSGAEISDALTHLKKSDSIRQTMFFSFLITVYGRNVLELAQTVYDLDFMKVARVDGTGD